MMSDNEIVLLQDLPEVVFCTLLSFLSLFDLLNLSVTCTRLRQAAHREFQKRFINDSADLAASEEMETFTAVPYTENELRKVRKHLGLLIQQVRFYNKINNAIWTFPKNSERSLFLTDFCVETCIALRNEILRQDVIFTDCVHVEGFAYHLTNRSWENMMDFNKLFLMQHHATVFAFVGYVNISKSFLRHDFFNLYTFGLRFPPHDGDPAKSIKSLFLFLNALLLKCPRIHEFCCELKEWGFIYPFVAEQDTPKLQIHKEMLTDRDLFQKTFHISRCERYADHMDVVFTKVLPNMKKLVKEISRQRGDKIPPLVEVS